MCTRAWRAYSHAAALQYFGDDADVYHVPSFEDAMVEVEEGRADYAVLPIENSSAGAVSGNYDNLVMHNLYIVAGTGSLSTTPFWDLRGGLSDIKGCIPSPGADAVFQVPGLPTTMDQFSVENTAGAAKKILEDQDIAQAAVASETARKALQAPGP